MTVEKPGTRPGDYGGVGFAMRLATTKFDASGCFFELGLSFAFNG